MLQCNKNRFKSIDVDKSMSKKLKGFRYSPKIFSNLDCNGYSWTDIRIDELRDKVYGNHR